MESAPKRANSLLRLLRKLISVAAIYALVAQPLLLALTGPQLAQASLAQASLAQASLAQASLAQASLAQASLAGASLADDFALAQLCSHQADGDPASPSDQQKHPLVDHCLLCFAGAFHLLDAPLPTTASSADPEIRKIDGSSRELRLASFSRYSIATPRGPPRNV
jgi:Pentapeptide repeats (8 copies)